MKIIGSILNTEIKVKLKNKTVKYLKFYIGEIVETRTKGNSLNVIIKINNKNINKIKKLLKQSNILSAEIQENI